MTAAPPVCLPDNVYVITQHVELPCNIYHQFIEAYGENIFQ